MMVLLQTPGRYPCGLLRSTQPEDAAATALARAIKEFESSYYIAARSEFNRRTQRQRLSQLSHLPGASYSHGLLAYRCHSLPQVNARSTCSYCGKIRSGQPLHPPRLFQRPLYTRLRQLRLGLRAPPPTPARLARSVRPAALARGRDQLLSLW